MYEFTMCTHTIVCLLDLQKLKGFQQDYRHMYDGLT